LTLLDFRSVPKFDLGAEVPALSLAVGLSLILAGEVGSDLRISNQGLELLNLLK